MNDFELMQALMARQAITSLIEQHALNSLSLTEMTEAVDAAVKSYLPMLATGRIYTRTVVLAGKRLADQLGEQGLEHEHFMELIKKFMAVGYYAGFFGIFIDGSLAATREDGRGHVRPLPDLERPLGR